MRTEADLRDSHPRPTVIFAFHWLLATGLALPAGAFVGAWVLGVVFAPLLGALFGDRIDDAVLSGWLLGAIVGMGVTAGIAQSILLRRWIGRARTWIPATIVGYVAGVVVGQFLGTASEGIPLPLYHLLSATVLAGLIIGLCQWFTLLRVNVRGAYWWPVVNAAVFGVTAIVVVSLFPAAGVGGLVGGFGAMMYLGLIIVGVGMAGLLGHPAGRTVPAVSLAVLVGLLGLMASGEVSARREAAVALAGHEAEVRSITWSPDGRRLASSDSNGVVWVWDLISGKGTAIPSVNRIDRVLWSPDGTRLAGTGVRTIVWDTGTWKIVASLPGPDGYESKLTWSRVLEGGLLAVTGPGGTIELTDVRTVREVTRRLSGHSGGISWLGWNQEGTRLASIGYEDGIVLIRQRDGIQVAALHAEKARAYLATWSPNGRRIAVAALPKTILIFDIETGKVDSRLQAIPEGLAAQYRPPRVNAIAWNPDGTRLAASAVDVRVWRTATWEQDAVLYEQVGNTEIAWDPLGRRLAIGFEAITAVSIWDTELRREVRYLRGQTKGSRAIAWSPDGSLLASGGRDGIVRVWRMKRGGDSVRPLATPRP